MPKQYKDLLQILGEVPMDGYGVIEGGAYLRWEQDIAEPRLRKLGYEVREWVTGERDSFGPLSRVAITDKGRLVYG